MTDHEEVIAALRHVFAEVKALRAEVKALRSTSSSNGHAAPAIASDSDLDGPKGDPEVRKDPKRWQGPPQAPCRMSDCSPEYLDVLADFLQWKADHPREGKEKYADYDRRDAAKARGWAKRKRAATIDEL